MSDATREATKVLLHALRERAIERNKVRDEIRESSKQGETRDNSAMPSWPAYQRAEVALSAAVATWEEAHGVADLK